MPRATLSLILALVCCAATPTATGAAPLELGIADPRTATDAALRADLSTAADLQARWVRLPVRWRDVAPPVRPEGFRPADPQEPAYRFGELDRAVRAARAAGLRPLLLAALAPDWAEGPDRPSRALPGTWKPDPAAFGDFVRALTSRYSGTSVDAAGVPLPAAAGLQVWNEPNLAIYLQPLWTRSGRGFTPSGPRLYRDLLRAAAAAIARTTPRLPLITAGTAPYGDAEDGGDRMQPARFVRELLCVDAKLRRRTCTTVPRFTALAHHPYSVGGPTEVPAFADDVALGDLGQLRTILRRAEALRALPGGPHPLWVTEFGWETSPDDPDGIPRSQQARWLGQAAQRLHAAGVRVALWFKLRDDVPTPSARRTSQSGLVRANGSAKPAARMFALPLAVRVTGSRTTAFLLPPRSGVARIQTRARGERTWRTAKTVRVTRARGVSVMIAAARGAQVRATLGALTSPVVTATTG